MKNKSPYAPDRHIRGFSYFLYRDKIRIVTFFSPLPFAFPSVYAPDR